MKDYFDALNDIIKSMHLAVSFVKDCDFPEFAKDIKTQFAVVRCLEIIGEATKRVPDEYRESNPDIPWKAMAGMRDRLIHGYDVVDTELVWKTVNETIPIISKKLKAAIIEETDK